MKVASVTILLVALIQGNWGHRFNRAVHSSKFCPSNSICMPISQCAVLRDLINSNCINTNKYSSLSCGYQGSGLVCCPGANDISSSSVHQTKYVDGNVCGQSSVQGDDYDGIGAYPWVARIGFKNTQTGNMVYPCTGSILNKRVILTTAHCPLATADNFKLYSVRIGEWSTNTDIDCGEEFCGLPAQDIAISHVIVHPGYEKHNYKNNIALIVIRSPLNFTVTAQPICLPETWSVTNNNGLLVGWGKAAGQTQAPAQQQALRLPIVNIRKCVNIYGRTIPITEDHVCAGGERGNDACSGFGGAPLIVRHGEHFYQVGILSIGSDQCGAEGIPSVYTNIKTYVTWIKENMPVIYNN